MLVALEFILILSPVLSIPPLTVCYGLFLSSMEKKFFVQTP